LGQIGQKLADCTVDTLVAAGVLYKSFEKTIKKAKNKYYKNIMVTSFMCDICKEFETDSEEAILKHKRIDHSVVCPIKAEKTLDGLCPHCGEYFKMLQQHILYKHETNKPYRCDQCNFAHASEKGLYAHIKHNHKSENEWHVCHICGYRAKSKSNVNEHFRGVHEKIKFKCNICEKEYTGKKDLKLHVKIAHLGELLECKECGEKFDNRSKLSRHVQKVHKGIKFKCKICKKEFRDDRSVKRHILNIHEGIKFGCDLCGKQFPVEAELKRHKLKIHSSTI